MLNGSMVAAVIELRDSHIKRCVNTFPLKHVARAARAGKFDGTKVVIQHEHILAFF